MSETVLLINTAHGQSGSSEFDVELARIRFASELAVIHGLIEPGDELLQGGGGAGMDTRQAELLALFRSFLGPDYDRGKMRIVLALQNSLHVFQDRVLDQYDHGSIDAETYVSSVNDAIRTTFEKCDVLLGSEDFERLFGCNLADASGYIDLQAFLEAEGLSRREASTG